MTATINGTVFEDLNRDAIYVAGDPGVSGVYVALRLPDGTCQNTVSDSNGFYYFVGLNIPGNYTLYETVSVPNGCPPTNFTEPLDLNGSTTQRVVTIPITPNDINNNVTFTNNFGHVENVPFNCSGQAIQVSENPSILTTIDLVTGEVIDQGTLIPSSQYNAIGYNVLDGLIYGYDDTNNLVISISQYTTVNQFPSITGLPPQAYNIGDVDLDGHLYLYRTNSNRFYVVDVNPSSPTYLKLVNPQTGFQEQTAYYGVAIASINITDWGFSPINGALYGINNTSGTVIVVDPIGGGTTNLVTTGLPAGVTFGAVWFDSNGNLYGIANNTGVVYRIVISGNTATTSAFTQANPSNNNDGARCPLAPVNWVIINKKVEPTAALPGGILTYTIDVTNQSNFTTTNVVITDLIPYGTTFVEGSVKINGQYIGISENPANGINIGNLDTGDGVIMTFQVQVGALVPNPNPVPNFATVTYDQGDPVNSNEVFTTIFDISRGIDFI